MASPIVHVEIASEDGTKSGDFYSKLFGWNIDSSFPGYTMFSAEGGPGGGFAPLGSNMGLTYKPGDVIIYIAVDDIDTKLREIESSGGKAIHPRTEIPGMGWFAIFNDPTGNRVGLFEGRGDQPAG
jgi:predicted enzyme related to lactoylglutathione lyase